MTTKFLVDPVANKVRGTFTRDLNFSIAGKYVINCPDSLGVVANTDSVSDLITAKVNAFKTANGLSSSFNDEFLTSAGVDVTKSSRFAIGPNKRARLLQGGGRIVTTVMTIVPAITSVFAHWSGFLASLTPTSFDPIPYSYLYNWDLNVGQFTEFDPTKFTVEIRDSTDTATLLTLQPDTKMIFAAGPALNFRLRFTNTDSNHHWYLSDWVLLYG